MAKKPKDAPEPTNPALLSRIDVLLIKTTVKAVDICRLAGLGLQFITQMRLGKCTRAQESDWVRLTSAVDLLEAKHNLQVTEPKSEGQVSRRSPEDKAMDKLARDLENADTLDKLIAVQRQVTKLVAMRVIDPARARVLNEAVARGQQLFRAKAEDEERSKAGQELVVVVKYIDTWRKPDGLQPTA